MKWLLLPRLFAAVEEWNHSSIHDQALIGKLNGLLISLYLIGITITFHWHGQQIDRLITSGKLVSSKGFKVA